jgi:hypothetical protein
MSLRLAIMHEINLDSRLRGNDRYRHPREGGGPVGVRKSFAFNLRFGCFHGRGGAQDKLRQESRFANKGLPRFLVAFGSLGMTGCGNFSATGYPVRIPSVRSLATPTLVAFFQSRSRS